MILKELDINKRLNENIPDNREAHTTIIRNNSNTQFKPREEINYNNNDTL